LVILAALNTAISIFYYLKMVKAAYSSEDNEVEQSSVDVPMSITGKLLGVGFVTAIIALGSFPDKLINLFRHALS
jgi:NADH-quinone oxidoreductase subunit N